MIKIPILEPNTTPSKEYLRELEAAIHSDGCTMVSELFHECCVYHDLGYRYGIDYYGLPLSRKQVDSNFKACIQSKSKLKKWSPISWIRFAGVRVLGYFAYPKEFPDFTTYKFQGDL